MNYQIKLADKSIQIAPKLDDAYIYFGHNAFDISNDVSGVDPPTVCCTNSRMRWLPSATMRTVITTTDTWKLCTMLFLHGSDPRE